MDGDFEEYVAAQWPRLVRAATLLGCSPHEAEDVAQTTLARCLVKWRRVASADNRDAYVHRILVNTFVDSRRRLWWRERPSAQVPDAALPDGLDAVDGRDALDRALARLSDDQRVAVVLRYYLDLSEVQMAAALRVAPGTVKSRLSRALAALAADPHLKSQEEPWTPKS